MVDVFDELSTRRESHREPNGQFGAVPLHPPEIELTHRELPREVAFYYQLASDAREKMSSALLDEIDATMPAEADFVTYVVHEEGTHLVVDEAVGDYGIELPRYRFEHIDFKLSYLGMPYLDFDGDLVIDSRDEYGWERQSMWDEHRDTATRAAAESAREQWRAAITSQQRAAVDAIWALMPSSVEALDFMWDAFSRSLRLAAEIHADGRSEANGDKWADCDSLAVYITSPEHSPLLRSELSGLYRLPRGA